jgi:hypothetical protein
VGANAWVPAGPAAPGPEAPLAASPLAGEPWEPIGGRAKTLRTLLWIAMALSLVAVVSDAFELELLGRIESGQFVPDSEANANDVRQGVIGLLQVGLGHATAVVFIMWFHRAYANVERLGAGPLRFGRGWAIGAWFVPILNLFRPKQIANDIWRGSDPSLPRPAGPGAWRDAPIPGVLFGFWWFLWLVSGIASGPGSFGGDSINELQMQSTAFLVSDALGAGAAVLCVLVVSRITERQEQRATAAA